jgi:hypothetical protein
MPKVFGILNRDGAAMLAAPIMAQEGMFTMFDVYNSFDAFLHISYLRMLQRKNKCGEELAPPRLFG